MKFTKMHGIGNDYVYVNCFEETVENPSAVARYVSDRHFGIGSDGLILIKPSKIADCEMDMYNLDGSQGAMCGNGIRCVAKYAYDYGIVDKEHISVATKSGIKYLDLTVENGKVSQVKVNMGSPILTARQIPVVSEKEEVINEPLDVNGKIYYITAVSMGNPHAIVYMDEIHLEGLPKELDFLNDRVHAYEKQKLSMNDIEKLVRILNQKLQDKGYVTTQVVIPEQNISAGTLHLLCLPGRLHQVIYSQGSKKLPWQNAFPIRDGDLLNLRMLEEGLENMKRVSSQEVSMKILPTAKAGYSDLELTVQQGKQVHGMLSSDDSGMKETGKYQWNAGIVFDDVFHANDTL